MLQRHLQQLRPFDSLHQLWVPVSGKRLKRLKELGKTLVTRGVVRGINWPELAGFLCAQNKFSRGVIRTKGKESLA
jgi:hypothetical protein